MNQSNLGMTYSKVPKGAIELFKETFEKDVYIPSVMNYKDSKGTPYFMFSISCSDDIYGTVLFKPDGNFSFTNCSDTVKRTCNNNISFLTKLHKLFN